MIRLLSRALLLAGTASITLPATAAEDMAEDRDYLPSDIVVTGAKDGYKVDDGSTGTKTPTPLIDVPQAVSILTADQLHDQAVTQLGDALRYVPGISLETGEGHRNEVFIRGQETTADFYLDGLRDDAQYYRSLYNVERVEVLKGSNALIFGRGGGGGIVNRVTKTANPVERFARFDGSVDSFGAYSLAADANQPLSGSAALRINATYEEFDSHRDFYEGHFIGIAPSLTVELGPDTRFTATYSYDDDSRVTDRGVPSLNGLPLMGFDETFFGVPGFNEAESKVHIARARIDHAFSDGLRVNATLQYADYDKVYANILPRSTDGTTVSLSGYEDFTQRENLIGQGNLVWQGQTGSIGHTVLLGFEAMAQDTQNGRFNAQFTTGAGTSTTTSVPLAEQIFVPPVSLTPVARQRDSELTTLSLYAQDQVDIGDHLQLVAGIRWDRFDLETRDVLSGTPGNRVDEMVSPRFGLIVKPQENLSLYASYSESFLPQAGDQFVILSPGDAAFEPEKFTNYEIGAKWLVRPDLFLTAAIFRLERSNTQAADPNNSGLIVLTGESRTEGVELALVGKITPFWQANIGYTYLDGEITSSSNFAPAGTRLQQLPKHQISAWNRFDLTDQFGLGFGVTHRGQQFASFSNSVVLPSYWRVDAAAFYELSERITLQLNIENLFDDDYYPSAHGDNNIQPAEPFSARIGVRVTL